MKGWCEATDYRREKIMLDLLAACRAWVEYEKECENKSGPDYGFRANLRKIAIELTTKAIAQAKGDKP